MDGNEQQKVMESVSCTSLACSSVSVPGVRTSLSAGNLKSESTAVKPTVCSDSDSKSRAAVQGQSVMGRSTRNQSPASSKTNVSGSHSHSKAVRQSRGGRSRRRPSTVRIELLSNWGHERLVGLTEIELFDANEDRIEIHASSDVTVCAASSVNQVDALFNRKCKVWIPCALYTLCIIYLYFCVCVCLIGE